jgi:hypothetical protein
LTKKKPVRIYRTGFYIEFRNLNYFLAGDAAAGAAGEAGFIAFTADWAVLAAALAADVAALAAAVAALAAEVAALAALVAAFAILLAAVFVAVSPQAIPRALIAKTADNAITFFIMILLSSQKTKFY